MITVESTIGRRSSVLGIGGSTSDGAEFVMGYAIEDRLILNGTTTMNTCSALRSRNPQAEKIVGRRSRRSKAVAILLGSMLTATWLGIAPQGHAPWSVAAVLAQKKAPGGAKVLLLSGGQREHHGYRDQAFYLASALEDTRRFQVTIVEEAAVLETPALAKYDLVIVNADRRDPEFRFSARQQTALLNYVKQGGGYVSIHGADNAAPDWIEEWRDMLGGVFSHIGLPDSKTKKGSFAIKVVNSDHPVSKGIKDFEIQDELYYNLQMRPGVEPLLVTEYGGGTWPIAWVRTFGAGRVFHTVLGHRDFGPDKNDPVRNPHLLALITQGAEWAARRKGEVVPATSPNSVPNPGR